MLYLGAMETATVSKSLEELADHLDYKINKMFQTTGEIDLTECIEIMENYYGTDWQKYSKFNYNDVEDDGSVNKGYRCVPLKFKGVGEHFDMWLTCWNKGCCSEVRDNAANGCVQRVLVGVLKETLYQVEKKKKGGRKKKGLVVVDERKLRQGGAEYIDNDIGLHKIENKSQVIEAVTLHIASPPDYQTNFYKTGS